MSSNFDISKIKGLSRKEVEEKLQKEGFNELPSAKHKGAMQIALEVIREPMFLLLVTSGILYLLIGDLKEALMLLGFVFVVIGITFYQERKSENALEALRNLASPRASVVRDGKKIRIAGREVVKGDILVIAEGDRVPADAILLSSTNISCDESLLTGESVPVSKFSGGDMPFIYSGTMVVSGTGFAEVLATGINTQIGKIGKALETIEQEDTLLQKEIRHLVIRLAVFGIMLCILVIIIYGVTRGQWLSGLLSGLALAMAMVPEEFPVVLTIFFALGAWRLSRKNVLARRVPVIETLGSATVLCVDKTGTLTLNRMTVAKLWKNGQLYDVSYKEKKLPENFHTLLEFGILGSQKDPFDPMEQAIKRTGEHYLFNTQHLHQNWELVREYPLSKNLLALSHVWRSPSGEDYIIAAKGAPEAIVDLCHLDKKKIDGIIKEVSQLAGSGMRVIGVAKAYFKKVGLPKKQHDFQFEFVGLLGLADPVRSAVPAAVVECYQAGIRVVMITGDYPGTAQSIGREIGFTDVNDFITGPELEEMTDDVLKKKIRTVNIFARVVPEQKLRIVKALKDNGEIVAMTGDGVNDAPALKAAHIGVAMGGRGTDVAREAAGIVVLDDDFSSIVAAVKMGRRIFDNLKKAIVYILAIHIPIAGLSLIPVLLGWPVVLYPMHIAFLELIIDPACSIVFENAPAEKDVMKRPPRDPRRPLFSKETWEVSLMQGALVLILLLAVYAFSLNLGLGEADSRTLTFTALIIANLALIFTNLSWSDTILETVKANNRALWWVSGGALFFLVIVLFVPFLRGIFHFSTLHPQDLFIAVAVGLSSIIWFEAFKYFLKSTP